MELLRNGETPLWHGTADWRGVLASRWRDMVAFAFILAAACLLAMPPLDRLAAAAGWSAGVSPRWILLVLGALAGWCVGNVTGALSTRVGRSLAVTPDRVVWSTGGIPFSAPLASLASVSRGRLLDAGTVRISFRSGRKDLVIPGLLRPAEAVAALRTAKRILEEGKDSQGLMLEIVDISAPCGY